MAKTNQPRETLIRHNVLLGTYRQYKVEDSFVTGRGFFPSLPSSSLFSRFTPYPGNLA